MTVPFDYPTDPHIRRHGPRGYANYDGFRPWLRDEFDFRCVFCLMREQWNRSDGLYDIDHFLPAVNHPLRIGDYDNLLYTCSACNAAKGTQEIPDPLVVFLAPEVVVSENGMIHAENEAAIQIIESLGLNDDRMTEFRCLWIGIIAMAAQHQPSLFDRLVGLPLDLPDLSRLRPPEGNSRPEGVSQSWYARRQRGENLAID